MRFEWDEKKRTEVISKHGIDFRDVVRTFDQPRIVDPDFEHSQHEERWRMLGFLFGEVIVVVYTERDAGRGTSLC